MTTPNTDITDPDIKPLWSAVAERLERGDELARIRAVRAQLSETGRAMIIGWLTSARQTARTVHLAVDEDGATLVPLPAVMHSLGLTHESLHTLINQQIGLTGRAELRRLKANRRRDLWAYAQQLLPDNPGLRAKLRLAATVEGKPDEMREALEALARVRALLPLPRPVHLARIALSTAGDPHYFDLTDSAHGAQLLALVLETTGQEPTTTPAADRAALAKVGILADRLSQTVLTYNLRALGDGPADRALNSAHADHRPHHLTYYDLTEHPPSFDAAQPWIVVENPSVIEEALARASTMALVCTSGQLTAVDHAILALARDAGVPIRYSGDLDLPGRQIAASVKTRYGAEPHLMDARTEQTAATHGPLARASGDIPALPGPSRVPAVTSPGTLDAGSAERFVVYQEHPVLLDLLLGPDPHDPLAPAEDTEASP
jgi:uncharacterized protein (TIGR02679 family)